MQDKDHHCLEAMLEAIAKICEYTSGIKSAAEFNDDYKSFDAVMMNFVVIGEMVDKLSDSFKDQHPEIDWRRVKGFRNLVAHNYFGIDAEEVWQIIVNKIPDLKNQVKVLIGY